VALRDARFLEMAVVVVQLLVACDALRPSVEIDETARAASLDAETCIGPVEQLL
jgi:hypothetical protein